MMGYTAESLSWIIHYTQRGILTPGCKIMELGSQDINVKKESIGEVQKFFDFFGVKPQKELHNFVGNYPVRFFYESAGYEYHCCDINGQSGSMYFDLNADRPPQEMIHAYDLVTNCGTTEHVLNALNAFAFIHDITKPNGYIRHSVPFYGWQYHGINNMSAKFWLLLIHFNQYEKLDLLLEYAKDPQWICLTENVNIFKKLLIQENDFEKLYRKFNLNYDGIFMHLLVKKNSSGLFIPPIDHLENDPNDEYLRKVLLSSMSLIYPNGEQKQAIESTVHHFLERKNKEKGLIYNLLQFSRKTLLKF